MTVYIVDIESIETRYTCEWKTHVPVLLINEGFDTVVIEGTAVEAGVTTPGAFLNFAATNIYKSEQVVKIAQLIQEGKVKDGDYFLFTDAWHPGVLNLRYMLDLTGIKAKIGGLWHAGSYDKHDFLGRACGGTEWCSHAELAYFNAYDHNYFATIFHLKMFCDSYSKSYDTVTTSGKAVLTGWPMEYMVDKLGNVPHLPKKNQIVFPHRLSAEKQLDIFKDLEAELPEYEFVVCQEQKLTKDEYHKVLAESKILWSASLQETLGISPYEGILLDVVPLVPNRLSYSEMFYAKFKYPSDWTIDFDSYVKNKEQVVNMVRDVMDRYDSYVTMLPSQTAHLSTFFFNASNMVETIRGNKVSCIPE